jgi:hypothetical protein
VSIKEQALGGDPHNLEAALAVAIKNAQSATAALEGLTVSLMLAASFLRRTEPLEGESEGCSHLNLIEIHTMGMSAPAFLCPDCNLTLSDAMHQNGD